MSGLTIPPRLALGDTVAVVSPSFGALGTWPHRAERGIEFLRHWGLEVKIMPNAREATGWTAGTPQQRADDLHAAFADPAVKLILCSIGGNHSNQLLPLLDHDLIAAHPKWFQGYSDITVLHWALQKRARLATIYGTALVTGLAEYPDVLPFTARWLRALWFGAEPLRYEPADGWTDEFLDWDEKQDLTRARELRPSEGWVTLRPGRAAGPVAGGCLETICWHLKGSSEWLDLNGSILLLETSEEAPSPAHVEAYLTDLEQLGVFNAVSGLLFARPINYTADDARLLWEVVERVTDPAGIPVLANVEAGHTDPMLAVPLGIPAHLDAEAKRFEVPDSSPEYALHGA